MNTTEIISTKLAVAMAKKMLAHEEFLKANPGTDIPSIGEQSVGEVRALAKELLSEIDSGELLEIAATVMADEISSQLAKHTLACRVMGPGAGHKFLESIVSNGEKRLESSQSQAITE